MPDFDHPPFVPEATQQPKQLQRWLDINPLGGPLGRAQTFIVMPGFGINPTWSGYSDIIGTYNYEGPNNFTLTSAQTTDIGGGASNYTLCIMWKDINNVTHRYSLRRDPNDVIFFNIPVYAGQLIKKNFRFEIWSVDNIARQLSDIIFYTSVLQNIDYRWSDDLPLVNPDTLNEVFNSVNIGTPISLPFVFPNNSTPQHN